MKKYVTGETFSYQGRIYRLEIRISAARANTAGIVDDKLLVFVEKDTEAEAQRVLSDWYIKQARKVIESRVRFFAKEIGEPVYRIAIKDQKSRWGSCSSKHNLNFNWRLIMAPEEVLDYVVVHELCHLKEMNHSKAFWQEVEKIFPNYELQKKWLKEHGAELINMK